jgi:hypothetical protein
VVIWHAFLALGAGFATMAAFALAAQAAIGWSVPGWSGEPEQSLPGLLFVNAGIAFLAAAGGGFVTAWLAPANPLGHIVALSIAALALAALSVLFERGRQPIDYQLLLVALAPIGAVAGGLLRLKLWGWF